MKTNKTLSEEMMDASLKVIERWDRDNPDFPTLYKVQQINYCSLLLHTMASKYESELKGSLKGKITNELH